MSDGLGWDGLGDLDGLWSATESDVVLELDEDPESADDWDGWD